MSKTVKIILILVILMVVGGGCILALLGLGLAGGGYFLLSSKKPAPTPPVSIMETALPDKIMTPLPKSNPTAANTAIPEIMPTIQTNGNLKYTYIGTGKVELPAGVRISYDEDGKNYKDFTSGLPFEFAQNLLKNGKWEIYSDNTFIFTPGTTMKRRQLNKISGMAVETGNIIGLATVPDSQKEDKDNKINIAGNINLDRSKPQLQIVFEYKLKTDKELNFGTKPGAIVKLTITAMEEVEKK